MFASSDNNCISLHWIEQNLWTTRLLYIYILQIKQFNYWKKIKTVIVQLIEEKEKTVGHQDHGIWHYWTILFRFMRKVMSIKINHQQILSYTMRMFVVLVWLYHLSVRDYFSYLLKKYIWNRSIKKTRNLKVTGVDKLT